MGSFRQRRDAVRRRVAGARSATGGPAARRHRLSHYLRDGRPPGRPRTTDRRLPRGITNAHDNRRRGRVGLSLAQRLEQDGENVLLVDYDPDAVEARKRGLTALEGDGTDADVLEAAGADDAKTVIATTPDDDVNLLVCQLAKTTFDVGKVASRVNQPDNVDAFESLGVHAIDLSMATAWSLENVLERPSLSAWMNELGRTGDVQEIEVTASDLVGKTIAEVNAEIPDGCIVGLLTHQNGTTEVPTGDHRLRDGDRVTFLGQTAAVDRAVKRFHPTTDTDYCIDLPAHRRPSYGCTGADGRYRSNGRTVGQRPV